MGRRPDVRFDSIAWAAEMDDEPADTGNASLDLDSGQAKPAYLHVAEVIGHFSPFNGDFRQAIETVDDMVANLQSQSGVQAVEVLEYPLDVRSDASVSGSATDDNQSAARAAFRMKLTIGVAHGGQQG